MKVYRLCGAHRDPKDFTGAFKRGGRWNSPGNAVFYCASSLSLACLEILVHVRVTSNLPELISTEIFVPDHQLVQWERLFHLERMDADRTQAILESLMLSRELGDAWIGNRLGSLPQEKRGVVLQVPSAVISQEWNYLINPRSSGFHGIGWAEAQPFHVDPRLLFPDLR